MATALPRSLTIEEVQQVHGAAVAGGGLAPLFLCPCSEEGTVLFHSTAFVIKCRPGGFMVAVPQAEVVSQFLEENHHLFGSHPCVLQCLAVKGKKVADVPSLLLDVPWEHLRHFSRPTALRGEALRKAARFMAGGSPAKPDAQAAESAAEIWIQSAMDQDTAQEYGSAVEDFGLEDGAPLSPEDEAALGLGGVDPGALQADGSGVDPGVVLQMQARIQELEAKVVSAEQRGHQGSAPPQGAALLGARRLGMGQRQDAGVLNRLQSLAGNGPPRLGNHEKAARLDLPEAVLDTALQEEGLGAVEEEELQEALNETYAATSDPLQKLLVLQAQQLSLLTRQVTARQVTDPVQRALGGSDSSGGGSSGLRGCLAREAFLKVSSDLDKFAAVGEQQMLTDLGLQNPSGLSPGLLQDYLERRVPVGEHRLLTQLGYLMAHAYELGSRSNNRELQGFAMKGMVFVEQTAIDSGRTNLSWLLTGLPEPNFQLCQRNRQRSQLQPFSKLANPAWVAANISYLKDLDFLEGKIQAAGKTGKDRDRDAAKQEDKGDAAPKPKRKPKGKGKGAQAAASGEDSAV